jgi:hypothetical protein
MALQVEILKPEANEMLRELAARNLISIRPDSMDGFMELLARFQQRATKTPISQQQVAKEVEIVRSKRYARKKR